MQHLEKIKIWLVLLLAASLLSLLFGTSYTRSNVPVCVDTPDCRYDGPRGELTITRNGFPAVYHELVTFQPANNKEQGPNYAGYAIASKNRQDLNYLNILFNIIFWYALLDLLYRSTMHYRSKS